MALENKLGIRNAAVYMKGIDGLNATVDRAKAQAFFQHREGRAVSPFER
jgi:hypothetical protein